MIVKKDGLLQYFGRWEKDRIKCSWIRDRQALLAGKDMWLQYLEDIEGVKTRYSWTREKVLTLSHGELYFILPLLYPLNCCDCDAPTFQSITPKDFVCWL